MKTVLLFLAAVICLQAHAQFPYFLQDHTGNNINYGTPVDIEFDGLSTVYSLHASSSGPGVISVKYASATGAVSGVYYLTRGNAALKPVRTRTLAGNYYVLCNITSGAGVSGYCLVSINASSNTINWAQGFAPPTGGAYRNAIDFVLDGGSYAYILSSAYDAPNNQNDVGVTKFDITSPSVIWDNIYPNITRNEFPSNIIYRSASSEVIVSAISADLVNPATDRGPTLIRLSPGGGYIASMLYKYIPGCNNAEPEGTWVFNGTGNFYLSSTSAESGANGPVWLAKINPASLGITIQSNHRTGTAYLKPQIEPVLSTTTGSQVLISGSSPASAGYVHLEFTTSALSFSQGVVYPGTNPLNYSPIYDVYIAPSAGMNIFSIAENAVTAYHYYLLKTSDAGQNDCDDPYSVSPDICTMGAYTIPFAQVPIALTTGPLLFTISTRSNTIIQPCYVPLRQPAGNESEGADPTIAHDIYSFPNPTKGIVTLSAGKSILSDLKIYNTDGKVIPADIAETAEGVRINLSGKKAGVYLVQLRVDGEPKTVRVVLETE